MSLDQLQAPVTIIIVENDEEGFEPSGMVVPDHLKDADQILVREIDLESRSSLDKVVRPGPGIG